MDEGSLVVLNHVSAVLRDGYRLPVCLCGLAAVLHSSLLQLDQPLHVRETFAHQVLTDQLAPKPVGQHLQERLRVAPFRTHCLGSLGCLLVLWAALVPAGYLYISDRKRGKVLLLRLDYQDASLTVGSLLLGLRWRFLFPRLLPFYHFVHAGSAVVGVLLAVFEALE